MEQITYEDKKTGQVKVQFGVGATINKKFLAHNGVYDKFWHFTTLTFNAINIYKNTELQSLAQKYIYVISNFAGGVRELKNNLDKMNASLEYEIKKVKKRGM